MNRKRKSNLTTSLLLLLPVLFFAGIALISRGKKWGKPAKKIGQFSFIIEDIQFKRLPLDKSKNWRMNVKVYVGQKGSTPDWWGRTGSESGFLEKIQFQEKSGKQYNAYAYGGGGGYLDDKRQQYVVEYRINTGNERPKDNATRFRAILKMEDRATGKATLIPISKVIEDKW